MNLIKEKQLLCERTLLFESIITRTAVHSVILGVFWMHWLGQELLLDMSHNVAYIL